MKISRFTQKFKETFSEAWERFKELLRACPHHGFTELTQVDTFYNGLNENEQDSLNAVTGLLERRDHGSKETSDKSKQISKEVTAKFLPPVIPISIPEPDVPTTSPKTIPIPESDIPKSLPKLNIP
ncbi:reverse transcriptase domain-containing protein [Tanacetum coccineum]